MIEIKWRNDPTYDKRLTRQIGQMFIDGVAIQARLAQEDAHRTSVKFRDAEGTRLFLSQRFRDLPDSAYWFIDLFKPPGMSTWSGDRMMVSRPRSSPETVHIEWLTPNLMQWARPWTFAEYEKEIRRVAIEMNAGEYVGQSPGFSYELQCDESLDELRKLSVIVTAIHEQAERSLAAQIRPDSVVTYFDFPPEVRTVCGQYLLFFGQFLAGLGVAADCELKEELGQVLFAVTPTDHKDALDKIREALDRYLHFPSSPVDGSTALSGDIELQRLVAQIQHLNGQLLLAGATIQQQQTHIRLLTGEIVVNSVTLTNAPVKDREDVLGGRLEITKYEGKGFAINLPQILREMKEWFKKK